MGLPLSPVMANIFLDLIFIEKKHDPLSLDYLNSKHQNINFTIGKIHFDLHHHWESQSNNHISFLDVLIRKDYVNFNTTVFRKSTFSGLGVGYFSYSCRTIN